MKKTRKKKRGRGLVFFLFFLIIVLLGLGTWQMFNVLSEEKKLAEQEAEETPSPSIVIEETTPDPEPEPVKEVKLMAVGDNLIHTAVWNAGRKDDGSHDRRVLYKHIKKYLKESDLKIINQETILGGDDKGLQDYPLFNTPTEMGDVLVDVGFNVIQHSSNHSLDMGQKGIINCATYWEEKHPEITVLGIYKDPSEQSEITVLEKNGITFALLNYSYSHNALTFSTYAEGYMDMLCAYDENTREIDFDTIHPQVLKDIERAEELADFTIVMPHWGVEYTTTPTDQEYRFAKLMTEAGADLIIGTHPHVCQPVEWVEASNGNKALCYYSLGNFTSAQNGIAQMLGAVASLTIIQDEAGTYIDEESIKAVPVVTHFVYPGWSGSTVVKTTYLLKDYTKELAAKHGLKNAWGITLTTSKLNELAEDIFGEYLSME